MRGRDPKNEGLTPKAHATFPPFRPGVEVVEIEQEELEEIEMTRISR